MPSARVRYAAFLGARGDYICGRIVEAAGRSSSVRLFALANVVGIEDGRSV
jgi:hypothetical protein